MTEKKPVPKKSAPKKKKDLSPGASAKGEEIVTPDDLMEAIIKARTHKIEKIGGEIIIEGEEFDGGEETSKI